jgi:hypothetical protein
MTTIAFLIGLWALGQCFAPGLAQEPNFGDTCATQYSALTECQASAKGTSRALSDECIACQGKVLSWSIFNEPCDKLHGLILDAYQKCTAECFPSDYECSQVEMESYACTLTDLECSADEDNSGNGSTSTGGNDKTANGRKDDFSNNVPHSSGALETALPIMATLLMGCIVLLYELESDIGHAVSHIGI